jgi:hypothetical protein
MGWRCARTKGFPVFVEWIDFLVVDQTCEWKRWVERQFDVKFGSVGRGENMIL